MKRALALACFLALTGCPPDLSTPRAWRCDHQAVDKDQACSDGWYCAQDDYCHSRTATGDLVPCTRTTVAADCATGAFCGADRRCHAADAGEALLCNDDTECGGGWRCGVRGLCYDRAGSGALQCRRDAGTGPLYLAGDCDDAWRCGVDGRCHTAADAGSIACAYPTDTDCTDGWRCSAKNECVSTAGEALLAPTGTAGAAGAALSPLAGVALALGPSNNDGWHTMLLKQPGGVWLHIVRRIRDSDYTYNQAPVPSAGLDPLRLAIDIFGGVAFQNGKLVRWTLVGNNVPAVISNVVVDTGARLGDLEPAGHRVDSVRVMPIGVAPSFYAAFLGGGGPGEFVWLLAPDGGFAATSAIGPSDTQLDVIAVPLRDQGRSGSPEQPCWLSMLKNSSGGVGANVFLGPDPAVDRITRAPSSCHPAGGERVGDTRIGERAVLARYIASRRRIEVDDLETLYAACEPISGECNGGSDVQCDLPCAPIIDMHPVRTPTGPGVEFECGGATPQRGILAPQFIGAMGCVRTTFHDSSLLGEGVLSPRIAEDGTVPIVVPGEYVRAVTEDARIEPYRGIDRGHASPWYYDRVPVFVANLDFEYVVENAFLGGMITDAGVIAKPKDARADALNILGIIPGTSILLTPEAELKEAVFDGGPNPLTSRGRIDAQLADFIAPFNIVLAARSDGGSELAVTANDTLYTTKFDRSGGMLLQPRVTLPPGSHIVSAADTGRAAALGVGAEVWLAQRLQINRAYERTPGRWSSDPLPLELPADVVTVWTTQVSRSRVGLTNGEVYSLPSALALAATPPLLAGEAQAYLELCGQVFMLDEKHVFRLGAPDARGVGQWSQLPAIEGNFLGGRLYDGRPFQIMGLPNPVGPELVAFERHGTAWRVPITGCQ